MSMKILASGCGSLRGVFRTGVCALLLGFAIGAQAQTTQAGSITAAPGAKLPASTPTAPPASSRLDEILARGTLRICTTGDYKPYSFLKPDGQFEGIDIDAAQNLAQSMNVKAEFIKKNDMAIFRFHDHWHARNPDGIEVGMVHALGWEKFQDAHNQYLFTIPETPLEKLASDIKRRLGIGVVRVVGDPNLRITKLALAPGAAGLTRQVSALEMPGVHALVIGEAQEWEAVEYVADAVSEGKQKSLIILGHIPSEQAGMAECARWLKAFVTEVPVQFVPAREPFWSPKP